jgi:cytochrome c551/c552
MKKIFFFTLCLLLTTMSSVADVPKKGKAIFTSRCASCHHVSKVVVGPALGGIDQRRSLDWIVKFVQSSQTAIKSGDKDAVAMFEQFNKVPMPDHKDLSKEDISNIIEYIKSEEKPATTAPVEKVAEQTPGKLLWSSDNYLLLGVLIFLALLLIGTSKLLVDVKRIQKQNKHSF